MAPDSPAAKTLGWAKTRFPMPRKNRGGSSGMPSGAPSGNPGGRAARRRIWGLEPGRSDIPARSRRSGSRRHRATLLSAPGGSARRHSAHRRRRHEARSWGHPSGHRGSRSRHSPPIGPSGTPAPPGFWKSEPWRRHTLPFPGADCRGKDSAPNRIPPPGLIPMPGHGPPHRSPWAERHSKPVPWPSGGGARRNGLRRGHSKKC
jgi:hypothetical protein